MEQKTNDIAMAQTTFAMGFTVMRLRIVRVIVLVIVIGFGIDYDYD
ncbi:MAG: hypothetical protein WD490_06695 [Opitutales bacterium]